jgi:hypothetical protein
MEIAELITAIDIFLKEKYRLITEDKNCIDLLNLAPQNLVSKIVIRLSRIGSENAGSKTILFAILETINELK